MDISREVQNTADRRQSKALMFSTNVDRRSLKKIKNTEVCLQLFYPHSSIVKSVFDCRLSGVRKKKELLKFTQIHVDDRAERICFLNVRNRYRNHFIKPTEKLLGKFAMLMHAMH